MSFDLRLAFDIALGIAGFLGGVFIMDLKRSEYSIWKKLTEIEVLVAGKYPTRLEMDSTLSELFNMLRRIEDKLDGKADKASCLTIHGAQK